MLEARYTFTLADYRAVLAAVASRQRFGPYTYYVYLTLYFLAIFLVIYLLLPLLLGRRWQLPTPETLAINLGLIAAILVVFGVLQRIPWFLNLSFRRLSMADKPVVLTLSPDAVTSTTAAFSSRLDWSAFQALVVGSDHFVLMLSRIECLVVPQRGFTEASAYTAALELARSKVPGS